MIVAGNIPAFLPLFANGLFKQLRHEDSDLFTLLILNIVRELARRLQSTDDLLLKAIHGPEAEKQLPKIVG